MLKTNWRFIISKQYFMLVEQLWEKGEIALYRFRIRQSWYKHKWFDIYVFLYMIK